METTRSIWRPLALAGACFLIAAGISGGYFAFYRSGLHCPRCGAPTVYPTGYVAGEPDRRTHSCPVCFGTFQVRPESK